MAETRSETYSEPDISSFLKARRAALDPADAGLPAGIRQRRVPGLRREEAAQLAGISVDYYTRIEQGRGRHISDSVLDSIARALRLNEAEHTYLRNVAEPARRGPASAPPSPRVRPQIRMLLDAMKDVPAYVYGPGMDVLAWNRLGGRISFDFDALPPAGRNMMRLVFLDPAAKALYGPHWERNAEYLVANLRASVGRRPDDLGIERLVGELRERSALFRRFWESQNVAAQCHGTKVLIHPVVGELALHYETMLLPSDPDQILVTYTAEPGSPSADALRLLGAGASGASSSGSGAECTTASPETARVSAT
jgi:transcriptional regulator with XRE-family HTH domain